LATPFLPVNGNFFPWKMEEKATMESAPRNRPPPVAFGADDANWINSAVSQKLKKPRAKSGQIRCYE
jgi:hypothetical protein